MSNKFLIGLLLLTVVSCKKENIPPPPPPPSNTDSTFTNPLLSSGPDPWITQKDSFYYYMHTIGRSIGVWKTKTVSDLVSAEFKTIWSAPSTGNNSENVWAPELHYLNNKWYIYYTAGSGDLSAQRLFVLENASSDPFRGTWSELGQVADPNANYFAIDATIFPYNNRTYIIWSGQPSASDNTQNLYLAELGPDHKTLQTSRVLISRPTFSWETIGSPPAVNEGPQILKNQAGKVFLIYSASGCWTDDYGLGMLTLKDNGDPLNAGDWTKTSTPVFTRVAGINAYGPGHNTFFKSKDGTEDWFIYHANSTANQGCGNTRNPRMQKFTWNADGTPNFGVPVNTGVEIRKPSGEF